MIENETLVISEKFTSIQGEGATMGRPSIFLRLAGCNLLCKSDSWVCDSIEVWKKGKKTLFEDVLSFSELNMLKNRNFNLIITGGEPLLHQVQIIKFIKYLNENHNFVPFIEIETNGTIIPKPDLLLTVSQWNCSPKLSNSGEPKEKRINLKAIKQINSFDNSIFKFVINNTNDINDILDEYYTYISPSKIVLMPAGETREKLNQTREEVAMACINLGFRYSDRLHIIIWNKKTGV